MLPSPLGALFAFCLSNPFFPSLSSFFSFLVFFFIFFSSSLKFRISFFLLILIPVIALWLPALTKRKTYFYSCVFFFIEESEWALAVEVRYAKFRRGVSVTLVVLSKFLATRTKHTHKREKKKKTCQKPSKKKKGVAAVTGVWECLLSQTTRNVLSIGKPKMRDQVSSTR